MNVYRGCTHGCIYCDSRSVCYQISHPFEDIEVKRNADQILDDQLRRRRNQAMIHTGSMCDPYIPLEEELKLTRRCLEVIARRGFGLTILSKSDLMLRDMDLLEEINRKQMRGADNADHVRRGAVQDRWSPTSPAPPRASTC